MCAVHPAELMQHAFEKEEHDKIDDMHKHLYSANW
jgi:hypothetical protein